MTAFLDAYTDYLERMYDESWDLSDIDSIVTDASPTVYEWLQLAVDDEDIPF